MQAVCFLWHWPAGYPEWALPTTLPCGARTFLEPLAWRAAVWLSHPAPSVPAPPAAFVAGRIGQC